MAHEISENDWIGNNWFLCVTCVNAVIRLQRNDAHKMVRPDGAAYWNNSFDAIRFASKRKHWK